MDRPVGLKNLHDVLLDDKPIGRVTNIVENGSSHYEAATFSNSKQLQAQGRVKLLPVTERAFDYVRGQHTVASRFDTLKSASEAVYLKYQKALNRGKKGTN